MAVKTASYQHRFRYPIDKLSLEETVLEAYPDLACHAALVEHAFGENDWTLRFAMYLGEGSGLHKVITDFAARKVEALRLSGIDADHPRYQGAFDLTDHGVQIVRWTWMKLFGSRLFRAYIASCAAYDQNCMKVEAMIVPEEPEPDISKLSEEQVALMMLMKPKGGGGLKADAEQRAYKLRNDLVKELSTQDDNLREMELKLFYGDEELKQIALSKEATNGASWEDQIFGAKGK